jgi:hypothetical protein
MDNMANTDESVKKDAKSPPRSPRSGAILKPFNSVTAKQAAEASARARNIRKQFRAKLLDAAVNDGKIDELFLKALKSKDADQLALVEKALKIVGLLHDQSEDAVTKLKVDATTDNKTALSGKIEFVLPEDPQ